VKKYMSSFCSSLAPPSCRRRRDAASPPEPASLVPQHSDERLRRLQDLGVRALGLGQDGVKLGAVGGL